MSWCFPGACCWCLLLVVACGFCEIFEKLERQSRIIFGASASGGVGKNKIAWVLSQAILVGC